MSDEKEYYVIYPKKKGNFSVEELERIVVVAQNSLAEVENTGGSRLRLIFPDNFQAREFREKLVSYFPNWVMRRIKRHD